MASVVRPRARKALPAMVALALVAWGVAPHAASAAAQARPAHFWRTATQAVAIADRQPDVQRLRAHDPTVSGTARPDGIGLWIVTYRARGSSGARVLVEDRTGDVLAPSPWAWRDVSAKMTPLKVEMEIACALLSCIFLMALFDFRRLFRLANLDVVALLSLGVSLAFFDRGEVLVSVLLVYPPLLYLLGRLATVGFRGIASSTPPVGRMGERTLTAALLALIAMRIGFDLGLGETTDVGYASVLGANSIHHGWPLYSAASNHLDTYGPVTYLAYLPFELVFPMHAGWQHDYLPAARAAAIAFDLLTMLGLFLLGGRVRDGRAGRRLGLVLALAWAAYPFTFMTLATNTNDGVVPLLVVFCLLAIGSPRVRGALLGLAVAAKFAPLALAGVLAAGTGDRRLRSLAAFGAVAGSVVVAAVWAYLPDGGLHAFWNDTIGFQMQRHSFLSIWGQYPQLWGLREALEVAAAGLCVAAYLAPGRRDVTQVAALAGAILIALELSLVHWFYTYVVWFLPLALAGLLASPARETAREPANIRAWPTWRPTASSGYAPATPQP